MFRLVLGCSRDLVSRLIIGGYRTRCFRIIKVATITASIQFKRVPELTFPSTQPKKGPGFWGPVWGSIGILRGLPKSTHHPSEVLNCFKESGQIPNTNGLKTVGLFFLKGPQKGQPWILLVGLLVIRAGLFGVYISALIVGNSQVRLRSHNPRQTTIMPSPELRPF